MNFLKPSVPILNFMRLRGSRPPRHKLKQPEDKSTVILGKWKPSVAYPKPGVSDKAAPIHVKWERPVHIETVNPIVSGDIDGLEHFGISDIDLSQPRPGLEKSKSLVAASEDVKRVMSLEFARRRDLMDTMTQEVLKSVQRHPHDFNSPEVMITMKTIKIRSLQKYLIDMWPYKNQPCKHQLTHLISARRKALGRLRQNDYKKYEWLLEKLNLLYKPQPHDAPRGVMIPRELVARKASIERLTDLWCDELKRHRLKAYERKLQEAQPEFLRRKAEKLRFILAEEAELGLEPTVTEEQVLECELRASEITRRMEEVVEEDARENLIFREEVQEESLTFKPQ